MCNKAVSSVTCAISSDEAENLIEAHKKEYGEPKIENKSVFNLSSVSFLWHIDKIQRINITHWAGKNAFGAELDNYSISASIEYDSKELTLEKAAKVSDAVFLSSVSKAINIFEKNGMFGLKKNIKSCYGSISSKSSLIDVVRCFSIDVSASNIDAEASIVLEKKKDTFLELDSTLNRVAKALSITGVSSKEDVKFIIEHWIPKIRAAFNKDMYRRGFK